VKLDPVYGSPTAFHDFLVFMVRALMNRATAAVVAASMIISILLPARSWAAEPSSAPTEDDRAPLAQGTQSPGIDEHTLEGTPTLESVEAYAEAHNPAIVAARHGWEAARQRIPQVRAYENPMVTYSPDTGNMAETRAGPQGTGVGVSQAIPFPGKLTLRGRIAGEEAAAASERLRATSQEVLRQVRVRYAELYVALRSLDVNHEVTDLARQFAEIAEAKYRVGKAAQQDVILAREEISRLRADEAVFEGDRDAALGALNALLDRSPRAPVGPPEELRAQQVRRSLAELVDAAEQNRPELRAQDHLVEASRRALSLAKMDYLPDFRVGGQYTEVQGGTNPMFAEDGHDIWMATLGISIPIWIDRIEGKIGESRAQAMQSESARRDLANRVGDEVQRAYERTRTAARTEEIYGTTLIPQTDERVGAARAGYQTGIVDFLTLIDSLKSLERARLDRYRAIRSYHQSLADLERSVGLPAAQVLESAGGAP
jgi:outer membrane protein, heavy metal efflux system